MSTDVACDWCGNTGHTPADHPLPADHPHYDPDLDDPDNALMRIAAAEFADWQQREAATPAARPATPIGLLLGSGPAVSCNAHAHWWPTGARCGDPCLCGERRRGEVA